MSRSIFCMLMISSLLIVASAEAYESGPGSTPETVPEESGDKQHLIHSGYLRDKSVALELGNNVLPEGDASYYYYPDHPKNDISIGVRGFIMCKSGQNTKPLAGAVAKIQCITEGSKNGYEAAPLYTKSCKADEYGFFFASFYNSEVNFSKLRECKAFLEKSSDATCDVPTDVNYGISGATLSSFTFLPEKFMRLYTVKPFIFTSRQNEGHY